MTIALLSLVLSIGNPPQSRAGGVKGEVAVERVIVDAHVTDRRGEPLPGLTPADFQVLVDGVPVTVEAADWVAADQPEVAPPEPASDAGEGAAPAPAVEAPPGRLMVLFFQTNYESVRLRGFMRMVNEAGELLDRLLPTDRVAVLSYDSHLKLRLDFTADRAAIKKAIFEAISFSEPEPLPPGPFPSLAARFDFAAARKAYTVEKGMTLTARALAPILGAKSMLYFGWGFQVNRQPNESRDYAEALQALYDARLSVFTLDVSDADYHTLETQLMVTSDLTGGTYQKTHIFPRLALARVERALGGRYVLVFARPPGARGYHRVQVKLAGRRGTVIAKEYFQD